jgi:hypothetical protein
MSAPSCSRALRSTARKADRPHDEEVQLLNAETAGAWRSFRPDGRFFTVAAEAKTSNGSRAAAAQADELADWVVGAGRPIAGAPRTATRRSEMIHAVYESARCHERVVLPMQTRLNPLDLMSIGPTWPRNAREPTTSGRSSPAGEHLRGEEVEPSSGAVSSRHGEQ